MTVPADPPSSNPPRQRRRGPRRWRLVAVLALVVWLAGRGLGWIGTAPTQAPGPPENEPQEPTPAQTARGGQEAAQDGVSGADPAGDAASGGLGATSRATQPVTAPPAPVGEASLTPSFDADRFASLLSLVDLRLDQGEVGRALSVLAELAQRHLSDAQRDAVALRRQLAEQAIGGAAAEVRAWLRSGDVRLAAGAVRGLLAGGAATAALLAELPCGADPERAAPANDGTWRAPEPLAKGRAVRVLLDGTRRVGTIVDSRSDRVTLRINTGQGVTFPTVALPAVEPVEPTAAEAVSMAWASLHANDALAARLWLACAELRGDGDKTPGAAELARVIR